MHSTDWNGLQSGRIERQPRLSTQVVVAALTFMVMGLFPMPSHAWWGNSHGIMTQAAVLAQPQEVPAFFRKSADAVAHMSFDPDIAKNRAASNLYDSEFPEHYFDLELLKGEEAPDKRHAFIELCNRLGVGPSDVGYAPYAITESTQRLMIAFAEHRKWPDNQMIQSKILVYAGILAHYAEDLAQPLHATIDFDGRLNDAGEKEQVGIHEAMDSIIERLEMKPDKLALEVSVAAIEGDLFAAVLAQAYESNGKVDDLYELAEGLDPVSEQGKLFAEERARRAVAFTARLYLTAWQRSAAVRLPGWLER